MTEYGTSDDRPSARPWQDASLTPQQRVETLVAQMTLPEKLAQLVGLWVGTDDTDSVAPHQHDMSRTPLVWEDAIAHGLGQLTRPFGTKPVEPAAGVRALAAAQ